MSGGAEYIQMNKSKTQQQNDDHNSPIAVGPARTGRHNEQSNANVMIKIEGINDQKSKKRKDHKLTNKACENGFSVPRLLFHAVDVYSSRHAKDKRKQKQIAGKFQEKRGRHGVDYCSLLTC